LWYPAKNHHLAELRIGKIEVETKYFVNVASSLRQIQISGCPDLRDQRCVMRNNGEIGLTDEDQTLKNDPSNGPTEQPEFTETVLNLVVAVFFYSILAYAFMFISSLPPKYEWLLVFVGATVVLFL
jgi:hypothetical protein